MPIQSATWLRLQETGSEIHFSAVTQLRHTLSLKIATDTDTTESTDYLNGARVQPAKLTLSLMETDAGHPRGYAARIAQNLEACRASRALLQIFTPLRTYRNMLLSDLVILQEEGSPDSWTGTATFIQAEGYGDETSSSIASSLLGEPSPQASSSKTNDNSSTITDTGSTPSRTVSGGGNSTADSPLRQLLRKAGIELLTTA